MKRLLMFILPVVLLTAMACNKEVTRDDYEGTWNASDSYVELDGSTVTQTYSFTIAKSASAEDKISISGFANLTGSPIEATVNGDKFTLPTINITVNGINGSFSGNGSINDDELTYTYSISSTGVSRTYNGKATK